ncbi:Ku protein [Streptomyces sp. NPDC046237]|uniref:Ku protein n=1 Tax=Streptomyces sp. NPDC046237 TaxID=3154914 RepID=UPI0033E4F54F
MGGDPPPAHADGQVAGKPYILLRRALGRNEKVAVAKVVLRCRERLGLVFPYGDAVLHAMRRDDDAREIHIELWPGEVELTEQKLAEAMALLEARAVYGPLVEGIAAKAGQSSTSWLRWRRRRRKSA